MAAINRIVSSEAEREAASRFIASRPFPFTMSVTDGKQRSTAQNKLQRKWMLEIAEQRGDVTPEEVRGECKLMIGVPILRAENEAFREAYDRLIRPLAYQDKLAFMMEPMDLPVTRIMTTKQLSAYLDGIIRHFGQQGIVLTMPEDLRQNPGAVIPSSAPADEPASSSGGGALTASPPSITAEMRKHMIDFARKGFSNMRDLREGDAKAAIAGMAGAYMDAFGEDIEDVLKQVMQAMTAVNTGKRTEAQAVEFITRALNCRAEEIRGVRA